MNQTDTPFTLARNAFGKLILTNAAGLHFVGVEPVRAFPIEAPQEGIAIVSTDGAEVAWIERLDTVAEPARTLIQDELALRECLPVLQKIISVSSFSTPCTWQVETDRGATAFVLRGDEDIRRIGTQGQLLIADSHGILFLVPNHLALDAHSRKLLDRFL